jgi:curved DNA-binding protein CbpA
MSSLMPTMRLVYQDVGFLTTTEQISSKLWRMVEEQSPTGRSDTLYDVLGLSPNATRQSIVHAYRRRAHSAHPDALPNDPSAAARFMALAEAYRVLGDPVRRAAYDRSLEQELAREASGRMRARPFRGSHSEDLLDGMERRPSGPYLWAGSVRVEPLRPGHGDDASRSHAPRYLELDRLAALLIQRMVERWSM